MLKVKNISNKESWNWQHHHSERGKYHNRRANRGMARLGILGSLSAKGGKFHKSQAGIFSFVAFHQANRGSGASCIAKVYSNKVYNGQVFPDPDL